MDKRGANILVTGGAGFAGSSIAIYFKMKWPGSKVYCLDNLKRRGSELNLNRLREHDIQFIHGDIRNPEDLSACPEFDILIECSAEPSVQAGYGSDPTYLLNTNLVGALNCLESCRTRKAAVVFISTSRVYPIAALRALPLEKKATRLQIRSGANGQGWSEHGISREFTMQGARSLYGATKFSAELFIQEYSAAYGLESVINRCGVLTGPWQMGKVDQGFMSLWAGCFTFGGPLSYIGFDGLGFQVRDILNIADLCRLLEIQLSNPDKYNGKVYNVGGGHANSVSLLELTAHCEEISGKKVSITSVSETHPADIPYYITDNSVITRETGWTPEKNVKETLEEIFTWMDITGGLSSIFQK